jgi:hypothetical protein
MITWQTKSIFAMNGDYLVFVVFERDGFNVITHKWNGEEFRWHDDFTEDTLESAKKHAERLMEGIWSL